MSISVQLNEQEIMEKSKQWEMVKCPFCFKKFGPFGPCFRAPKTFGSEGDDLDDDYSPEERKYVLREDEKLKAYSGKAGMYPPVIRHGKFNPSDNSDNTIISNKYELDEDGFPCGLRDTLGNVAEERLCPLCHNTLPEKYGKYPVVFVGVIGITKSGKTVYLSQLLNNINRYLPQLNLSISGSTKEMDDFIQKHPIKKAQGAQDCKLPDNTVGALLPSPIPLTIENNETHESYTVIFYDIAGENCVDVNKMDKYGPFIKNANSFLMIIDPIQFASVFDLDEPSGGVIKPEKIVQTMFSSFLADDTAGASNIPFAVAFSKSDLLIPCFARQARGKEKQLLGEINYARYGRQHHGLAFNDFQSASAELERILKFDPSRIGENFVNTIRNRFSNVGYFSFSALSVAPVSEEKDGKTYYYLNTDPVSVRIEEPLAWLFWRLGISPAVRERKEVVKKLFGKDEEKIVQEERYIDYKPTEKCGGRKIESVLKKDTRSW